ATSPAPSSWSALAAARHSALVPSSAVLCRAFSILLNDPPTSETSTLSLHDALPISGIAREEREPLPRPVGLEPAACAPQRAPLLDRKSTRLNSSHQIISYAVFCLQYKKNPRA